MDIATDRTCRFIWITDVLLREAAAWIRPLMEHGARALTANVEASSPDVKAYNGPG